MKTRIIVLLLLALLAIGQTAMAQPFQAFVYDTTTVLTTTCGGSTPIPDGAAIQIYWDNDNNGADGDDPQPPLCSDPPTSNEVNVITLTMNGEEILGEPGKFYVLDMFQSCIGLPNTPKYWLKVCYGSIRWQCAVQQMSIGIQEWSTTGWTCIDTACGGCPIPQPPGNFQASDSNCTEITLTWTFPDTVSDVDSFFVFRDGAPLSRELRTAATNYTYHDLTAVANTTYQYGIEARRVCIDDSTVSSRPGEGGARPPLAQPATVVTATDGTVCDTVSIAIEFAFPPQQGDSFVVKRNDLRIGAIPVTGTPGTRFFRYAGIDAPTRARYCVVGKNAICPLSETVAVCDSGNAGDQPLQVQNVLATDSLCNTCTITWTDVLGENSYQVWRANGDGSSPVMINSVGAGVVTYGDNTGSTGVVYRYWIVPINTCGSGPIAQYNNGSRLIAPGQVTGVNASDATSCDSVTVRWTDLTGETIYRIYRSGTLIDSVLANVVVYKDLTASPGTSYNYAVTAVAGTCAGTQSNTDPGSRRTVPGQVGTPTASTNSCTAITVSWLAVAQADSYLVRRNNNIIRRFGSATLTFQDTDSVGTFAYTVMAKNTCGDGPQSVPVSGTRSTGPAIPAGVAASDDSCGVVRVTWSAAAGAEGYIVQRDGVGISGPPSTPTFYRDLTAGANQRYAYTVVSTSAACGSSNPSLVDSGGRAPSPGAVNNLLATAACDSIVLTWNAATNATSYTVLTDGGSPQPTTLLRLRVTPADTDPHAYRVFATNACGNGDTTGAVNSARLATPAAPTALVATGGTCSPIALAWTDAVGSSKVRIYRDTVLIDSVTAGVQLYTDTNGPVGIHSYHLVAVNACGTSGESAADSEERLLAPTAPTNLTASSGLCSGIELGWVSPGSGDIDSYTVRRDGTVIATGLQLPSYTDTDATPDTHEYTVQAISDQCDDSPETAPVNGTRLAPPGAVADLVASDVYCDRVEIDWSGAPGDVDSFIVSRDGTRIAATIAAVTDFTDVIGTPDEYNYSVVAWSNECGIGPSVQTTTIGTVAAPPTAATNLTATANRCDGIFLQWTAGANLDGYEIYRDNDGLIASVGPDVTSFLDDEATVATHAYFVIAASANCGQADPTDVAGGERLPNPPQVTGVAATDNSCENVTVTWDAATGNFDTYRVDRDGAFLAFVTPPTTSYVDLSAVAGETYEYMVCANDEVCGLGPFSVPDEGIRQTGATIPANLTASTDNCTTILLSWDASTGTVDEYRIYRDGDSLTTVGNATTDYSDLSADPGVNYVYEVAAYSAACGETQPSDEATGLRLPVLGQVLGLTATADHCDGVLLNWTAITGAASYNISRDGSALITTTEATYLDTSAMRGVSYSYTVAASNLCGDGLASYLISGSRAVLPGNVETFSASDTLCAIVTLTWGDVTNETKYYIYRDAILYDSVNANIVTYSLPGDETVYQYWVIGMNACGASLSTPVDLGSARAGAAPATELTTTNDRCDGVLVTWTDGANATSYQVYRNFNTVGDPVAPGVQEFLDTGAPAGTNQYSVAAINECGNGGLADTVEGVRLAAPDAITDLTASQDFCDHVILNWTDLATETSYEVWRDGSHVTTLAAGTTTYNDTPLTAATYSYEIFGVNECGDGAHATASGRVVDVPGQVVILNASSNRCDGVLITWDPRPEASAFDVLRDDLMLVADNLPAGSTEYLDVSVEAGQNHFYTVTASNACGDGDESAPATGARVPVPGAPAFLIADSTCAGASLSWGDVEAEAWYRIYRDGVLIDSVAQNIWAYADINAGNIAHNYCVEATNACGTSAQVCDAWAPIPRSAAVGSFTVIPSCTADTLRWAVAVNATGYQVKRNGANLGAVLPPNATEYIDTEAHAPSVAYRVISLYTCGNGDSTADASSTRLVAPAAGPSNVQATDNLCPRVDITWTGMQADSFVIYRNGTRVGAVQAPAVTFSDTPEPGTYTYCVRAKNACGESPAPGNCDSGSRLGAPPIVPPISATENSCSWVRITWTPVQGATQYRVLRNEAALVSQSGDSSGYTDAGATAGTTYAYSVIAANLCGDADTSGADNGTRLVSPGQPTGVSATDDRCDSIVVTWSAAAGDVDWYAIFAGTDSVGQVAAPATRFAYQPAPGFTAGFTVRARSTECGPGNASAQNSGARLAPPAVPTNCRTSNPVCDQITVLWNAVNPAPLGYVVWRDAARLDTVTTTQLADTAIDDALTHTYVVTAYNLCGESAASNSATGNALPLLRLPQGVPDTVRSLENMTVALAHCLNVQADTVFLSMDGGDFMPIDTLPGSAGQISFTVPWTQDTTDNNRLRIVSVRDGRVDVLLTETFVVLGTTAADDRAAGLVPTEYYLDQNFPNPFNPSTTIRFGVPRVSDVKIEIYDLNGRLVTTLAEGAVEPGVHSVTWNCSDCPTGMYLLRLTSPDRVLTRKMLLMK